MSKHIHLVSFLINSPINHTVLSWAQPSDNRLDALADLKLWQELAQTLERGKFDAVFFADTPGVFDRYRDSHEDAVRYGVCWPSLDPVVLLSALAAATRHLGLATTMSTSAYQPWTIVRQLGTIDYLSGGRVGWNIVTGHLRGEHRALGLQQLDHDRRYDRADEYMEICYELWNSIRPDAIVADRSSGIYADPAKVDFIRHRGEFFSCETVGPVPPSPQGRPVLFQAGSSGRGQQFAVSHADVVFSIQPNVPGMKRFMTNLAEAALAAGKPTPGVSFGIQPIVGGTEEEARRKLADLVEKLPIDGCLARLSGTMGVNFEGMDLDQPLAEIETQASQGLMKAFANIEGGKPLTLREVAVRWGLAVGKPQIVGTPEQVADEMERIWRETGCFGYNVTPTVMASSVTDFVDEVVPLLQKKGVYRTEYEGTTLRENLGL
ncbi:LLM class flavin-dependent oxidoreductase [Novosphingobium panipatense]|jgi:FMN-dependent oxidoreductase (nitrilotriacetate monooxygenase family)|uniref:FMN-dependent oxidoreductase, nitrilotriacetate monooxygenase family n=1 Tax=Novosphingobium panipatense TaxID=428991 RepID=A0ABY1QSS4_9SPHN|nr:MULTISPECIES: LLM class flavin-dependent oxidoreductase [Novosphingobium]SMP79050.1 FMN-dependent oxidoreductase, nitrilotriacetate monooxygenase family [Novosphingobium panipatense]